MTRIGSSDLDVFPLVFGGNVFGWTVDQAAGFALLDAFVDGGGTMVDTADGYSWWVPGNEGGESETVIGAWMASRGNRDQVLVATKVGWDPRCKGLHPDTIVRAADASLTRLGTDRIDLYYAHFDDPDVPMADFVGALSALVDAGKVRYIAPSNFTAERLDEWAAVTAAHGAHHAVALQPHYNLVERGFETNGLRDAATRQNLGVLPYFALANGFLTGKYRPGARATGERAAKAVAHLTPHGQAVLGVLDQVAATHGVEVATVALAWLRVQPTVVAPIASASRLDQLPALLASATLELSPEEIATLSST
ncbi:MAG: aldo/keto reductase [Micrococcales bacterium]|nr:aldo/keto reductase [Micrococcales bacterium]MCL2666723.1 aldo/keto reductase [Micrococcales bacterium]